MMSKKKPRERVLETESAESYAEIFTQPKIPVPDTDDSGSSEKESIPEDIIIEESEITSSEEEKADKE